MALPRAALGRFPRKRDTVIGRGEPETASRPSARSPSGDLEEDPRRMASRRLDPMGGVGSGPPAAVPRRKATGPPRPGGSPTRATDLRRPAGGGRGCPSGRPRSPGRKAERTSSEARATSDVEGGTGPRGGPTDLRRRRPSRVGAGSAPNPHTGPTFGSRPPWRQGGGARSARTLRRTWCPGCGPRGRRTGRPLATRGPAWGARPACRRTGVVRPRSAGTGGRTGPNQHPKQETRKGLPGWMHLLARLL